MLKSIVFMLSFAFLGLYIDILFEHIGFFVFSEAIFVILLPMICGIAFIVGTIERGKQEIIEALEKQNEQQEHN